MSLWKSFGLAIFAVVCLLGETAGSAQAQCESSSIHNCATEWSGGGVINLGGLPGFAASNAYGINDAGQVVGVELSAAASLSPPSGAAAASSTWEACRATRLASHGINNAGQVVGASIIGGIPTPPSGAAASVINLGGLPGRRVALPRHQ